uniref:Uncharacterized protein n=1 Tax=Anguilla anguilla TaxID=7936 RepID=A0A0E9VPM0_ANGAN
MLLVMQRTSCCHINSDYSSALTSLD